MFHTIFGEHIVQMTRDTNRVIIKFNQENNFNVKSAGFIPILSTVECYNFLGLILTIHLRKTDSMITRDFIRDEFVTKDKKLFKRIGGDISDIKPVSYERFQQISRFYMLGEILSGTINMNGIVVKLDSMPNMETFGKCI